MKKSLKIGFSFGLTSGVITTLGLLVGLSTSTSSKLAVIGGILTIAIADALSDALGIHIAQESQQHKNILNLWISAGATFIAKLLTALTFVIPVLMFDLFNAVIISITWGLLLLGILSFAIAKNQKEKPSHVIVEHLSVGIFVIIAAAMVGDVIARYFNN